MKIEINFKKNTTATKTDKWSDWYNRRSIAEVVL
jgi:hypothetical protein